MAIYQKLAIRKLNSAEFFSIIDLLKLIGKIDCGEDRNLHYIRKVNRIMRMWVCLAAIVAVSLFVLGQIGLPEADRASWYSVAMTFIGFAMCWGGVEASRWMLRESPIANTSMPKSDWGKLWIWSGVPSGLLMLFWLMLAWACSSYVSRPLCLILIGQALIGPAIWLVSSPWMIKDIYASLKQSGAVVQLAGVGMFLHLLGCVFALYVFPPFVGASLHTIFSLISSLVGYYALAFCHLLLIGCSNYLANLFGILPGKK